MRFDHDHEANPSKFNEWRKIPASYMWSRLSMAIWDCRCDGDFCYAAAYWHAHPHQSLLKRGSCVLGLSHHESSDIPHSVKIGESQEWLALKHSQWPGSSKWPLEKTTSSRSRNQKWMEVIKSYMAVGQNLVPLVNIKIAGKWMFIPLKMVLIGIDS